MTGFIAVTDDVGFRRRVCRTFHAIFGGEQISISIVKSICRSVSQLHQLFIAFYSVRSA